MLRLAFPVALGLLSLGLAGCGSKHVDAGTPGSVFKSKESKPPDPMETSRSGMHEGAFQLSNAAQDLQTALSAAKKLQLSTKNANLKAALADVIDGLNDAGASVADFTGEPPELADYAKEFDVQDKKRLDAIDGANDALHEVNDASGTLDEFVDQASEADAKLLNDLNEALDTSVEDLTEAIKAFGGKVEEDDTEPIPAPTGPTDKSDGVKPDS